ncbi:hypothetical protein NUU61_008489 [Penicillium alfredii]|uniref:N-acetylglucosamine-induced protein 1 n=1 Tax=Penicillium alfredii TaxID=1506179 RepID=A0A9W9JWD0_9EURO|nr:uncharacterized protein NUU61_008489 [Penicillium alfredii]KAJ5083910.1 hypothetical protein NUU61_008489 [Penicillium alfredii]
MGDCTEVNVSTAPAFNLTALDQQLLVMTDEEYVAHDWEELRDIIDFPLTSSLSARNDLGALKRKPSDLRRYLAWSSDTKAKYGSIMNYICQRRLQWQMPDTVGPLAPFKNPCPFADPEDYRILRNDWPYGLSPGISHLVVWLRTPIPVQSGEGHLTDESRALVENFVQQTFVARLARDVQGRFPDAKSHVLWFKNWVGLQSVRALEHVHVLVRDVPEDILLEWSGEK